MIVQPYSSSSTGIGDQLPFPDLALFPFPFTGPDGVVGGEVGSVLAALCPRAAARAERSARSTDPPGLLE